MAGAMLALLGDKVKSGQKYHPISELALAQNQNVAQRTCNVIAWQAHDGRYSLSGCGISETKMTIAPEPIAIKNHQVSGNSYACTCSYARAMPIKMIPSWTTYLPHCKQAYQPRVPLALNAKSGLSGHAIQTTRRSIVRWIRLSI